MHMSFEKSSDFTLIHLQVGETGLWACLETGQKFNERPGVRRGDGEELKGTWVHQRRASPWPGETPPALLCACLSLSVLVLKNDFPCERDSNVHVFRIVKVRRNQARHFSMCCFLLFFVLGQGGVCWFFCFCFF